MKLYIKQKVFSFKDKFTVKDEDGQDKYTVEGEFFSLGKRLHVYDRNGEEVAFIKQQFFSIFPRYFVFCGEKQVAEIEKEITFFKPKYNIKGPDWQVGGSVWEHDYWITQGERQIVTIRKEWMSWGDTYELDIADPANEIQALAAVLVIDCATQSESTASISLSND